MAIGFHYESGNLCVDGVPLEQLAEAHGTPLYVYSAGLMRQNYRRFTAAFTGVDLLVAYSVKSNSNLGVLEVLRDEGAGFDIVSGGELERGKRRQQERSRRQYPVNRPPQRVHKPKSSPQAV